MPHPLSGVRATIVLSLLALSSSAHAQEWQVRCDRGARCAVEVGGRTLVRAPAPGPIACAEHERWLACTWRGGRGSAGWFVDLPTESVHRMGRLTGARGRERLEGEPRWDERGVALTLVSRDGSAISVHRAPPGWFSDLGDLYDACVGEDRAPAIDVAACAEYLHRSPPSPELASTIEAERAEAIRALRAAGHAVGVPASVRAAHARALRPVRRECVVVDLDEARSIVSFACRRAMCGDPPAWHPYELDLERDRLLGQQC